MEIFWKIGGWFQNLKYRNLHLCWPKYKVCENLNTIVPVIVALGPHNGNRINISTLETGILLTTFSGSGYLKTDISTDNSVYIFYDRYTFFYHYNNSSSLYFLGFEWDSLHKSNSPFVQRLVLCWRVYLFIYYVCWHYVNKMHTMSNGVWEVWRIGVSNKNFCVDLMICGVN